MIKHIYFDVAGTLLGKPDVYLNIQSTLLEFGYSINFNEIKLKHKLLSEVIHFPDRTDESFYDKFNAELFFLLGVIPTSQLLKSTFKNCTYLPWVAYEDTEVLRHLHLPLGVISNFNTSLKEKLNQFFGPIFSDIYISEEVGVAKPDPAFYKKVIDGSSLNPDEILFVGDSIKLDLKPASELGLEVLILDRDNFYPSLQNRISSLTKITDYL